MINGETVALGPIAVDLTHEVEAGRVIISGFEVLRLEQTVPVRELDLPQHLLVRRAAHARHVRGVVAGITSDEGRAAHARHRHRLVGLAARRDVRLAVDHDGLLRGAGMLENRGLLRVDEARLIRGRHGVTWLLLC